MNQKLFTKDFTLVVLGQIVSLFGNAAIRFALPYLITEVLAVILSLSMCAQPRTKKAPATDLYKNR